MFNGSGKAVDKGPQVLAEDYLDIQGLMHSCTREHSNTSQMYRTLSSWSLLLADRTATQYDRLLASSGCPSVCPSICLSVCDAVHSDSQGWCTGLKVTPACS